MLMPKRESDAASARARRARTPVQAARSADDAGAGCGHARQAQPHVQAAGEAGDAGRVWGGRGSGRRRALGQDARGGRGRDQIEPAAARLLAERCGTDVKRLRNDVDRLLLYALGQKIVTVADVKEIAGPNALQDDWAMANAIEAGDAKARCGQLALMIDAGAPAEKVLGQLGWLVRTKFPMVAPAALKGAIDVAIPDRPRPQALGWRAARPARASRRRTLCGEAGARRRRPLVTGEESGTAAYAAFVPAAMRVVSRDL